MRKIISAIAIAVIALTVISCGGVIGGTTLTGEKELFLSKDQLQKDKRAPTDAFYNSEHQKLALAFRTAGTKKLLQFFDFIDEKPTFYFQTEEVPDIFPPSFGQDLSISYALLQGKTWKVFMKLFLPPQAPREMQALETLIGLAFDYPTQSVFVSGTQQGKTGIFPKPFEKANYRLVDSLFFAKDHTIGFRALKEDGVSWIIYMNEKESEPFNFISHLAFDAEGNPAYIARDSEDNWYTVLGSRKTKLQKKYQQIGQVKAADKSVVFAAVLKDAETWSIISDDTVLVSGLLDVPDFIVRKNRKIAYKEVRDEGVRFYDGETFSPFFAQVEDLAEDDNGNPFAKIKNQFGLWQVTADVKGDLKSDQYVWMSEIFKNPQGQIFFVGLTSSGDLEIFKFRNK